MKTSLVLFTALFACLTKAEARESWAASQLQLKQAHFVTKGSESIRIAIIDTGIDIRVTELERKIELDPENGA